MPRHKKEQIAAIFFLKEKHFQVQIQPVQQQCGIMIVVVFTVAFATSLYARDDPTQISYKQHFLRNHLISCLEKGIITTFPRTTRPNKSFKPRAVVECNVYCSCRLPEGRNTIQCDGCSEWYHADCMNAPSSVWTKTTSNSTWHCCDCNK